jgi:hypothetical protein
MHFRRAHIAFRETTNLTLEQSELAPSHANLVQQVVTGMQAALAAEVQPVANAETNEMFLHIANSAAQASEAQLQLQHQLAQMQQHMQLMQAQMAASNQQQRIPLYPPPPSYNPGFFPNQQQQQPTGGGGFQGPSGFGINQVAVVVDIKDFNPTTNSKCNKDSNNHSTNSNTVDNNNNVDTKVVDKDADTKDVAKAVAVAVYAHSTATVGLMAQVLIQVLTVVLLPKATRLALHSKWEEACDTVNQQPDKSGRRLILTLN